MNGFLPRAPGCRPAPGQPSLRAVSKLCKCVHKRRSFLSAYFESLLNIRAHTKAFPPHSEVQKLNGRNARKMYSDRISGFPFEF